MKHCPRCAAAGSGDLFCTECGHTLVPEEPAAAPALAGPDPSPPRAASPAPRSQSRLFALVVAIVVSGVGSLMLLASATRTPAADETDTRPVSAATAAQGHAAAVAPATKTESARAPESGTGAPTWIKTVSGRRSPLGAGVTTFELASVSDIAVWRKQVRPVLSVRCGASTEVFVVTHSPASIEGDSRLHTVSLKFDGADEQVEQWEHSVGHDALFAPNGRALTRRIAAARTVTFTFTPFNAPPVTAEFETAGLEARCK